MSDSINLLSALTPEQDASSTSIAPESNPVIWCSPTSMGTHNQAQFRFPPSSLPDGPRFHSLPTPQKPRTVGPREPDWKHRCSPRTSISNHLTHVSGTQTYTRKRETPANILGIDEKLKAAVQGYAFLARSRSYRVEINAELSALIIFTEAVLGPGLAETCHLSSPLQIVVEKRFSLCPSVALNPFTFYLFIYLLLLPQFSY